MTEEHGEKTRDSNHNLRQGMLQLDVKKKNPHEQSQAMEQVDQRATYSGAACDISILEVF